MLGFPQVLMKQKLGFDFVEVDLLDGGWSDHGVLVFRVKKVLDISIWFESIAEEFD